MRLSDCTACSVSYSDEVIGELLDGVGGIAWLDGFGVVGDKKGLRSLDDDDALLTLCTTIH